MTVTIDLGDMTVEVIQKRIKNIHLSVYPPTGKVRISAPSHMSLDTIRAFAISKIDWVKRTQNKLREQERETPREFIDRESHYVWGKRHLLKVVEREAPPCVEVKHSTLVLQVRPGADKGKKQAIVDAWYRDQIREAIPPLFKRWEATIGVEVASIFVQKMKTRWGSCNLAAGNIRLNSELAKKPPECLEYVIVHELVHLLERRHNDRFRSLLDTFMPQWRVHHDKLRRSPLAHETWDY